MDTVGHIRLKAAAVKKTIVLPEHTDERVREAARIVEKEGIARVLLLTPERIDPARRRIYAQQFYQRRKSKGLTIEEASRIMEEPLYYAAMMTCAGEADGFVAGAVHTTSDVARASIHCLDVDARFTVASSCFIMVVPGCAYGEGGTFIFSDCGIIPEPNARQLAYVALAAADLSRTVLGITPRVAFLSYSTRGSSKGKNVEKVREGLGLLKELDPALMVDGELQVDAAIVPEVASIKYPEGALEGRANVLIFPDLESGNISYKLVQRLAKARAIGPIILGLSKPCSDLSRGCEVDDIVDCVAVTAIRAQSR